MTATAGQRLGDAGENLAAAFLERHGIRVIDTNVAVGRGEVDLICEERGRRFVVEVKTGTWDPDAHPRDHFTDRKARQVRELAGRLGIHRVDLVTVTVSAEGATIDWHRRAA